MSGSKKRKGGSSNYVDSTTFVRRPGGARREAVSRIMGSRAIDEKRKETEALIRAEMAGTDVLRFTAALQAEHCF